MLRRVIAALVFALLFAATALPAIADDTYVNGYFKSNGTYVEPHFRSAPNGNPYDNYSTKGNINPYTGKSGTKQPYSNYGSGSGLGSGYNTFGTYGNTNTYGGTPSRRGF